MTVRDDLFTTLSEDSNVSALVTNSDSPETFRIYPDVAPDNVTKPYLVYMIIGDSLPVVFNDVIDKHEYTIRIMSYAETASGAHTLVDHIVNAVNGSMTLTEVFNVGSDYDYDVKLYRYICQITVWQ